MTRVTARVCIVRTVPSDRLLNRQIQPNSHPQRGHYLVAAPSGCGTLFERGVRLPTRTLQHLMHDTMATNNSRDLWRGPEVAEFQHRLGWLISCHLNMSFRLYKIIKAMADLVAVLACVYAIGEGADPTLSAGFAAVIVVGWEAVEVVAVLSDLQREDIEALRDETHPDEK